MVFRARVLGVQGFRGLSKGCCVRFRLDVHATMWSFLTNTVSVSRF